MHRTRSMPRCSPSSQPNFSKFGCKVTHFLRNICAFNKKVVPLQPHFGKSEAFDDVNRLVIRQEPRLKNVFANNI